MYDLWILDYNQLKKFAFLVTLLDAAILSEFSTWNSYAFFEITYHKKNQNDKTGPHLFKTQWRLFRKFFLLFCLFFFFLLSMTIT